VLVAVAGMLLVAAVGQAQVAGLVVEAETTCDGPEVTIHAVFTVYDELPTNLVGWVVEREVLGECVETVVVGELRPLPEGTGEHEFVIQDNPVEDAKVIYYILAVDENGDRQHIPWPHRGWYTQANCMSAVAARGTVVEVAPFGRVLEVCPHECWWALSYFDPIFPPDQELPPVGATVEVLGEIRWGMEGPYIDATEWIPSSEPCQPVDNAGIDWGGLKALYR